MPLPLLAMGLMAGAKGLGSILGSSAKNKAAKAEAKNQTAANKWKAKLDSATYGNEKLPGLQKGAKTRSLRNQIAASIAKNSKYGLDKLLPGYFQQQQEYSPAYKIVNPYEVAGPPPATTAATGGFLGTAGAALGSAAEGAAQGYAMKK